MINQAAILLAALLVSVTLAVVVLVLLTRVRRVRDDAKHEHAVTRRRVMTLTGGEGPAWSGPVAVAEVLHAATRTLGEDGQDVTRRADTNRNLPAPLARDVCVIITELLDNALCYSDASEEVTLFARAANDGSLLIEIEDSGDGMSRDTLRLANRTLKGAPPDDEEKGLGLVLAGRLAARHGIRVVLAARGEGTMASIVVPDTAGATPAPQRPTRQSAPTRPAGQAPAPSQAAATSPAAATPQRHVPPRQALAPADSGESTAMWAPPWATGGDDAQRRPAATARDPQARRAEPARSHHASPTPPPGPARPPARNGSHQPPSYPQAPAAYAGSGTGSLPLPPTPPGMGSDAPRWLTSSPDADPGRVPELGGYSAAPRGGNEPSWRDPSRHDPSRHEPYRPEPYEAAPYRAEQYRPEPYRAEPFGNGYGPDPFSAGMGRPHHQPREDFSPIFDDVASNWFDAPSAGHDDYSWRSPADQGWSAVEHAYRDPTPPSGGLPRREPMSHLVPGSVQPGHATHRPPSPEPRSQDTWASYQSQVSHGRRAWFRQVGEDADDLGNGRH